jgi:hypothetical protein
MQGGKPGRDSYEGDMEIKWYVADAWAKCIVPGTYIRKQSLDEVKALLNTFTQADKDFQQRMLHIDHEP